MYSTLPGHVIDIAAPVGSCCFFKGCQYNCIYRVWLHVGDHSMPAQPQWFTMHYTAKDTRVGTLLGTPF